MGEIRAGMRRSDGVGEARARAEDTPPESVCTYVADASVDTCPVRPVVFELLGRDTPEEALVLGDEVLIGQTVPEKLDRPADCEGRRLLPNTAHPDQPVTKVK